MIQTPNLQLLPIERMHVEALLRNKSELAALLQVSVPDGWPHFSRRRCRPACASLLLGGASVHDEVMLAPKERDFIFVRPPHAAAFFQGYGQAEIDWVALTYFLWERVVQDLIECTRNVWFREDWGEESRLEALQLFEVILAQDKGHIEAAYPASAHLPTDLTVNSRKKS